MRFGSLVRFHCESFTRSAAFTFLHWIREASISVIIFYKNCLGHELLTQSLSAKVFVSPQQSALCQQEEEEEKEEEEEEEIEYGLKFKKFAVNSLYSLMKSARLR